jgi:hypothetical protein
MDLMIAEFSISDKSIIVIPDFNFEIIDSRAGEKLKLNHGWRNNISLKSDTNYTICHGKMPLLEIQKSSNSKYSEKSKSVPGEIMK